MSTIYILDIPSTGLRIIKIKRVQNSIPPVGAILLQETISALEGGHPTDEKSLRTHVTPEKSLY